MMKHAWDGYSNYAWGKNELRPVTKRGHSASIFGSAAMGASIIDGMVRTDGNGTERVHRGNCILVHFLGKSTQCNMFKAAQTWPFKCTIFRIQTDCPIINVT